MPAIITNDLRIANSDYFQNDLSDIPTYVYFGRTTPWDDEQLPDDAIDSTDGRIAALNEVAGLKKIESTDVISVLPRTDWAANTVYDEYVDYANIIDDKNPDTNDFFRFYVFTDEFNVYKCISNNDRAQSTVKPSGVSTTPFQTPDGYVWKYMYTVKSPDAFKFMTPNWIPCYTLYIDDGSAQWDVQAASIEGAIQKITVTVPGSGYDDLDPPTITINGDGTGATASAIISSVDGSIEDIVVTNPGSGYTNATVDITATTGGGAQAEAVISPIRGHGSDARSELGAVYKMIRVTLDGDENGNLPINIDYRTTGMLIEPLQVESGVKLQVSNVKLFQIGEVLVGSSSGASGTIHSINKVQNAIYLTGVTGTFDVDEDVSSNAINLTQVRYIESVSEIPMVDPVLNGSLYVPFSGRLGYISNREKITRGTDQVEEIRLIVQF